MIITNKYNYPEAIVNAVKNDPYKGGGDISVTRLISPAQQVALQKIHIDDIEEDVSDRIWSLLGQAVHHVLERSVGEDIAEERVCLDILDWTVTGQFDRLSRDGTLMDYKVTSVWSVKDALENGKDEWEEQLNLLAYMVNHSDMRIVGQGESFSLPKVKKLQILAICRDWRRNEAMRYDNYPKQAEIIPIDLWDEQDQREFLEARVKEHQRAQSGEDIPCSKKERWTKDDVYAVMKKGRKSAVKLFDSEEDALDFAQEIDPKGNSCGLKKDHFIEKREGKDTRCEDYCNVRDFCKQFKGE